MNTKILFVDIIFAMYSAYIIYIYLKTMFQNNVNHKKQISFIVIFGVGSGVINSIALQAGSLADSLKPLVYFVFCVLLIRVIIRASITKAALAYLTMLIGLALGNIALSLVISFTKISFSIQMLYNDLPLYILINLFIHILATALILFSRRPIKFILSRSENTHSITIILLFNFLILVCNIALQYLFGSFNLSYTAITFFIVILSCAYTIKLFLSIHNSTRIKTEYDQQKFYNDSQEQAVYGLRRFKHDWNNNLMALHSMLKMKKYEDATGYLSELIEVNAELDYSALFNIKNAGLFSIIYAKLNQAKELGLETNIKVIGTVSEITTIKVSDLCEIMGIFFDNAIEASKAEVNASIRVEVLGGNEYINILVANKCSLHPNIDQLSQPGFSTKGTERGYGLYIVKNILKKNRYVLNNTYLENGEFVQEIVIKLF